MKCKKKKHINYHRRTIHKGIGYTLAYSYRAEEELRNGEPKVLTLTKEQLHEQRKNNKTNKTRTSKNKRRFDFGENVKGREVKRQA